jgi:glycosyltransferase involved in cell wall biosynthesis
VPTYTAPHLAAIIPSFRAAGQLRGCVEALRGSSVVPAEIIVVDDASDDGTRAVAEALGCTVLCRARNGGPSAARNDGWRSTDRPLLLFLDADTRVEPGAVAALLALLDADPSLMGANGTLAQSPPGLDRVSAFVNTALRYQLGRHGARVGSAFTSLCLMRRATLERMGGWDDRAVSRYADDVATRFSLPDGALAQAPGARTLHEKRVPLSGLLRHRANVGYHFVGSLAANRSAVGQRPRTALLDRRYPINTALAAASLGLAPAALLGLPFARLGMLGIAGGFAVNNAAYLRFVAAEEGVAAAVFAAPLTALESYAYVCGLALGALHLPRAHGGPDAPS